MDILYLSVSLEVIKKWFLGKVKRI